MFEIILLILIILLGGAAVGFVSYQRNQKLADAFQRELDEETDNQTFHSRFDAVLSESESQIDTDSIANEPHINLNLTDLDENSASDIASELAEADDIPAETPVPEQDWDLVIALTVMAPADRLFTGRAVKNALDNQDMHFGEMQIYHRFSLGSRKQSLFSIANIIDPGTFLPAELISMKTPGILLFARLPGPANGLTVLDAMVECATQMAEQLDGIVCDEQRQPLTESTLERLRNQIFELNLTLQEENRTYDDL
ncbi:Cell division protein ZipA [Methylophaga frappieri]|uniref:Cell division protein ZipA n=1 Tax=Methylophaga frappieri (strain ATCC BAA-2434 / DSM 25690 / JAM7) TaxID=754477 RepID=I1YE84_METFJ|nr:cell division protein ZipA [Methylophaga frappieri]AFJ01227.1 Cell division protein ZipA [Methylophaga frappieri]